ncbi:hypothetical protein CYQ88_00865 [Hydrogenovibrio sp. SC-1]|uniref:acyltransferase family protein n=1 Tax=Hydrogenovibrio sp. SC-1 TaxID=2065820 RepID=UPI000C7C9E9A|nr:acyltransferase [Hydrogenovibrio sp. SC-1]PLA75549.1 hypothetical protein CYQ88_00865 [Hydrogenovibrio sp. SC-1]
MAKVHEVIHRNIIQFDNNQLLIRYVLAFFVFYSHTFSIYKLNEPSLYPGGHSLGWYSVNGFFFISGILISQSFEKRSFISYIGARVLRLFPAFILSLFLSVLMIVLFDKVDIDLRFMSNAFNFIFTNFFPLQQIQYGGIPGIWLGSGQPGVVNTPIWTIPFEFFCYLFIVPLILTPRISILLKAFLFVAGLYFLTNLGVLSENGFRFDFLRVLAYFLMGVATYQLLFRNQGMKSLLVSVLLIFIFEGSFSEFFLGMLLIILILFVGFYVKNLFPKFSKYDLSYGFYIYAWPVTQTAQALVDNVYFGLCIAFLILLAVSTLSYFFLELPMLKQKRKFDQFFISIKGNSGV